MITIETGQTVYEIQDMVGKILVYAGTDSKYREVNIAMLDIDAEKAQMLYKLIYKAKELKRSDEDFDSITMRTKGISVNFVYFDRLEEVFLMEDEEEIVPIRVSEELAKNVLFVKHAARFCCFQMIVTDLGVYFVAEDKHTQDEYWSKTLNLELLESIIDGKL